LTRETVNFGTALFLFVSKLPFFEFRFTPKNSLKFTIGTQYCLSFVGNDLWTIKKKGNEREGSNTNTHTLLQFPVRLIRGRNLDFSRCSIPTVCRYEKYGVFESIELETVVTWKNQIGYPAQPGLIRLSVCLSVRPSICTYLQIRYSAENGTGPTDSVNYSSKS